MFKRNCLFLGVLLATTSCGDNTTKIIKSLHTVVQLQPADAEQCPYGGTAILSGVDLDEDGVLDAEEVTQTQVVCNGNESDSTLVLVTDEPAGENCAGGGSKVETGIDDNRDGILDAPEIDSVQYICDGTHGQTSLMRSETEPAGENCPEGGVKLSHGLDADADGVLDDEEVQDVEYVCNGRPGTGQNSLVSITDEPPGLNCEHGGYGLRSGLDLNGDHLLQPAEVENTVYVCDAANGFSSLIRREDEPAGGNCAFGGQAVLSGQDTDFNGYLDDMEVQNTSYVCHGADGADGIDGIDGINNLFETTIEPAGATCAAGGVWVISGPDANRNDLLDASEIQVEQVICNGVDGVDGVDGTDGTDGANGVDSLVLVTPEAAGLNCGVGGQKIETGIDLDRDGVLDAGEVTQTQYVCQGADGADGLQSLVKITAEAAGLNCATGGFKVDSGLDVNANGLLDVAEVQQTQFVCNGSDGLDGLDGVDGADGADGLASLVRVTIEAAGLNCAAGGTKIETGLDTDADGILDAVEVLQTQYVCHGVAGVDGGDGTDGANGLNSLVRVTAEAAGLNCSTGGTKIETGLDADTDGVLDPAEIAQTRYVCNGVNGVNGADGSDGFNSLVKITAVAPGVPCTTGGQRIETGLDLDRDNTLDAGEVTQTQYVCHGAAGADGSDGSDGSAGSDGLSSLVRVTTEPAGVHCTDGGSFVETGLDLDADGILDAGEITQSQYICNGVDGTDGLDGADGLAGINSLVRLTVEPAGANCVGGGSKVDSGLDTDGDNTLDAGEITQTQYVCHGAAGADGSDGIDGSNGRNSLVRITPEAIGANCAAGGNLIESGLDLDADGVLDAGEVTSTRYVCNGAAGADGADGSDGAETMLRASNAAWGGVCTFGGVKLETGIDGNGNGVLDDPEVTRTQYVCNRTASFVKISASYQFTCGVLVDGSAWCWGNNSYYQLGNGTASTYLLPSRVFGMDAGVVDIVAGWTHACSLKVDGTVWCWGENSYGQLGDNSLVRRSVPVQVNGLGSVSSIHSGGNHGCAVKLDGSALCWGANWNGQIGDNSTTNRSVPVLVTGLGSNVGSIAIGASHTCALMTNGSVLCWGANNRGQLGNNSTSQSLVPVAVFGMGSGAVAIGAGDAHSCLLKNDQKMWCWGRNDHGELGNGTTTDSLVPTVVLGLSAIEKIAVNGWNSCAVDSGAAYCWGDNSFGQIGDNTTNSRNVPAMVFGLSSEVEMIAKGFYHTCSIKADGSAWCWGDNSYGSVGDGGYGQRNLIPSRVASDLAP